MPREVFHGMSGLPGAVSETQEGAPGAPQRGLQESPSIGINGWRGPTRWPEHEPKKTKISQTRLQDSSHLFKEPLPKEAQNN
eukprot:3357750-Pyramimonas_sp.AAC.1